MPNKCDCTAGSCHSYTGPSCPNEGTKLYYDYYFEEWICTICQPIRDNLLSTNNASIKRNALDIG